MPLLKHRDIKKEWIIQVEGGKIHSLKIHVNDIVQNESTYKKSPLYATDIFSYEQEVPIKNLLQNTVENLSGNKVILPTDWT